MFFPVPPYLKSPLFYSVRWREVDLFMMCLHKGFPWVGSFQFSPAAVNVDDVKSPTVRIMKNWETIVLLSCQSYQTISYQENWYFQRMRESCFSNTIDVCQCPRKYAANQQTWHDGGDCCIERVKLCFVDSPRKMGRFGGTGVEITRQKKNERKKVLVQALKDWNETEKWCIIL